MALKDVTVAILAGGKGSRLKPVVPDVPKVLAPVNGRPFIEYIFDQLIEAGLRDVVLLTGSDGWKIADACGDCWGSLKLRYRFEQVPLGTAGAVFQAHEKLLSNEDEPVLVMNGDTLVKGLDFEELYSQRTKVVAVVVETASAGPGVRPVTIAGNIESIKYDPQGRYVNTGVTLLPQHFFSDYSGGLGRNLEEYLFDDCRVVVSEGPMLDIGTPEGYAAAATFGGP